MRRIVFVGLLAGLVGLGACKDKPKPAAPAPTLSPEPAPVPQSRVDTGLLGELAREAAQRPKTEPTIETVLAAFESAGIPIARKQQVLATPVGARYCVASSSKGGLNLSLCEYATPEAAKAGRDKSLQVFKALKGRTLLVQNTTLLTIVAPATPAATAERALAEKAFRKLQ